MKDRYYVLKPVRGGYAWWDVRDHHRDNMAVASFFRKLPGAGKMANDLCRKLNRER